MNRSQRSKVDNVSLSKLDASAAWDMLEYEYSSLMEPQYRSENLQAVSTGALELAIRQRSMSCQYVPLWP